jgi:hypothetical protein
MKTFVSIVALCGSALVAQSRPSGPRTVHAPEKSKIHVPAQSSAGLSIIFSNVGPPTNAFNDTFGAFLAGPASGSGFAFWYALPFTPKVDAHALQIRAAIEYIGSGANQINLNIYSDSGGAPGTLLAGPVTVTNLPLSGTCCILATANLSSPLAVTAGTQYWIVADTPMSGVGADFEGEWDFIFPKPFLQGSNFDGTGWQAFYGGYENPAAAVLGTTP